MAERDQKSGDQSTATRREFLEQATAAVATVSVLGGAAFTKPKDKPVKKVTTRILGANDRINLAFIGNGMQFLGLLQRGFVARKEKLGDFEYAAVCDVWEPRLKYAQEQTKAEKAYRDYREVIARDDIDGVGETNGILPRQNPKEQNLRAGRRRATRWASGAHRQREDPIQEKALAL